MDIATYWAPNKSESFSADLKEPICLRVNWHRMKDGDEVYVVSGGNVEAGGYLILGVFDQHDPVSDARRIKATTSIPNLRTLGKQQVAILC